MKIVLIGKKNSNNEIKKKYLLINYHVLHLTFGVLIEIQAYRNE